MKNHFPPSVRAVVLATIMLGLFIGASFSFPSTGAPIFPGASPGINSLFSSWLRSPEINSLAGSWMRAPEGAETTGSDEGTPIAQQSEARRLESEEDKDQ